MAEEDREQIAKLIAKLEAQQAGIQELLKQVKKAVAPHPHDPTPHKIRAAQILTAEENTPLNVGRASDASLDNLAAQLDGA
jgi:hypothetical protein